MLAELLNDFRYRLRALIRALTSIVRWTPRSRRTSNVRRKRWSARGCRRPKLGVKRGSLSAGSRA